MPLNSVQDLLDDASKKETTSGRRHRHRFTPEESYEWGVQKHQNNASNKEHGDGGMAAAGVGVGPPVAWGRRRGGLRGLSPTPKYVDINT